MDKTSSTTSELDTQISSAKGEGVAPKKKEKKLPPLQDPEMPTIATFWSTEWNDKKECYTVSILRDKFLQWVQSNGFYLYRLNAENVIIVRVVNNIIENTDTVLIKHLTLKYIKSLPFMFDNITKSQLVEVIITGATNYFSTTILDFLEEINVNIIIDTKDNIQFFFKNTVVNISPDAITTLPYSQLKGHIWKNHIIPHNFKYIHQARSDYDELIGFVSNVPKPERTSDHTDESYQKEIESCKELAQNRYHAFKSVIGYMLSTYKNRSLPVVPILCDMKISDGQAEGGAGKGIVVRGIGYIRRLIPINGKNERLFEQSFPFQDVNPDTQVIFFDDVYRGFEFEKLFSIITEGISVNKKFKEAFFMPFETSPKPIVSTNYTIKGDSVSFKRRKVDVEFHNHFNDTHKPEQEFGKNLFDDWDENEWASFFSVMAGYAQFYLKNGLLSPETVNLPYKKLISEVTLEFYTFFKDNFIDVEKYEEVSKNKLYMEYLTVSGADKRFFTQHKMTKSVHRICEYHGLICTDSRFTDKDNRDYSFDLTKNKTTLPDTKTYTQKDLPF